MIVPQFSQQKIFDNEYFFNVFCLLCINFTNNLREDFKIYVL